MYFASLGTEEAQPIVFHVVYLDPMNPDRDPPPHPSRDRWTYVRLTRRIPLTIQNVAKFAKASDPRTSSLAIYHEAGGALFLWGLVDQGNSYHKYVNFESERGYMRPGLFQASISGAGHVIAYIGSDKIAEQG
jgi:hypothetical protein